MLVLLALPVIVAVAVVHRYLQLYAPTNLLTRRMRGRQSGWRHIPLLVGLSAALLVGMHAAGEAVARGASGWLNLVVLVLAWDAIKVVVLAVLECARALRVGILARAPQVARSAPGTS